jgi:hypothetical protein
MDRFIAGFIACFIARFTMIGSIVARHEQTCLMPPLKSYDLLRGKARRQAGRAIQAGLADGLFCQR